MVIKPKNYSIVYLGIRERFTPLHTSMSKMRSETRYVAEDIYYIPRDARMDGL